MFLPGALYRAFSAGRLIAFSRIYITAHLEIYSKKSKDPEPDSKPSLFDFVWTMDLGVCCPAPDSLNIQPERLCLPVCDLL